MVVQGSIASVSTTHEKEARVRRATHPGACHHASALTLFSLRFASQKLKDPFRLI